jgi:general secretion pathway protein H
MMAINSSNRPMFLHRRQRGFTLIEIMVVVIVISVVISGVTIAIGGDKGGELARSEADKFMLNARYIAEESVLKGETHGLFVEVRPLQDVSTKANEEWCYVWRRVRDRQWAELPEMPDWRCLPEGVGMELIIDDEPWEYDPELEFQDPVLGFYPGGDASAQVEIAIYAQGDFSNDEDPERITLNVMGELQWVTEEERLERDKQR